MRYENPLYMAEDAGAADLISGGRLQLGISRGSPEQVIDGYRYFGYVAGRGHRATPTWPASTPGCSSRCSSGEGFAQPNPRPMFPNPPRPAADRAALAGPARPDLVGRGHPGDRGVDRPSRG